MGYDFGLLMVILVALNIAQMLWLGWLAFISAAYWFTASTSFANPAVTIARSLTDTFSGIHLGDMPFFILLKCLLSGQPIARLAFADDEVGSGTK